jgi:hypothetical protein
VFYKTEQHSAPTAYCLKIAVFRSICVLIMSLALLVGCEGPYRGGSISPPVGKVILFDMEGPNGKEFTRVLSIELIGACKNAGKSIVVLKANEAPSLAGGTQAQGLGSLVRDLEGQAYIKGAVTLELSQTLKKYYFTGNFQLYDAEKEVLIGGISDASHVADIDLYKKAGGEMSSWDTQRLYSVFARRVAVQLARGLGY